MALEQAVKNFMEKRARLSHYPRRSLKQFQGLLIVDEDADVTEAIKHILETYENTMRDDKFDYDDRYRYY